MCMISKEEMMEAISKLPEGAMLCVTQEGYYAEGCFAEAMLPEQYGANCLVFRIGHSSQNY